MSTPGNARRSFCERSITATDVIDELIRLMKTRSVPSHIRADNGPEFIAKAIRTWLARAGVGTLYVEPGAPSRERLRGGLPRPTAG